MIEAIAEGLQVEVPTIAAESSGGSSSGGDSGSGSGSGDGSGIIDVS